MATDTLGAGGLTARPCVRLTTGALLLKYLLVALPCDLAWAWLREPRCELREQCPQKRRRELDVIGPDEAPLAGLLVNDER